MAKLKTKAADADTPMTDPTAPAVDSPPDAPDQVDVPAPDVPPQAEEEVPPTPTVPSEEAPQADVPSPAELPPTPADVPEVTPDPVEAPAPPAPEAGADDPVPPPSAIVVTTEAELTALVGDFEAAVQKIKSPPKGIESLEIVRLGAAQILKSTQEQIARAQNLLLEMKKVDSDLQSRQKGLDDARAYVEEKSSNFRLERDAFLQLRSLPEKEYFALLEVVRAKA